jgi:hypothetical protein
VHSTHCAAWVLTSPVMMMVWHKHCRHEWRLPTMAAVMGLSCRFPRSEGPAAFWQNLVDGVDMVSCSGAFRILRPCMHVCMTGAAKQL